jgi:hypothetical protein
MRNTIAKYGIADADIYNCDETDYVVGQIIVSMVVTSFSRKGRPKLAQPGNRKWVIMI